MQTERTQILDTVTQYYRASGSESEFIPGVTPVPVSGKIIDAEDIRYLVDASLDGWLTAGRFADQFEREFARFMQQAHCMLVNSGSSANLIALSALTSPLLKERRLEPGDEVITVAAGFPTTVNPIIQNRLVPVFVDVNLTDYGIDVSDLEKAYSDRTKAIFLAHTLGNPFDLDAVTAFARQNNLWLVEDCCDAVGSRYRDRMVGTFGHLATSSFYPAHHITMGEGGAVLTNDDTLRKIVTSFRDWGRDCWCPTGCDNTCGKRFAWKLGELPRGYDHKYIYSHIGYNLKATDMQAALGVSQLKKLPEFIRRRKENYRRLYEGISAMERFFAVIGPACHSDPAWFGFPIRVREKAPFSREALIRYLDHHKIGTRQLFGGNLIRQPAYRHIPFRTIGALPNSDRVMSRVFWIGVYPGLTTDMIHYVLDRLRTFVLRYGEEGQNDE